ncbi:substrate-binding domain-containing protein [Dysgonomonas sp. 520]|uniref:hybrid sensor histidine kinase/response regulator transcription factor n=1 Tax=Dysgonomonas sp. 520 TaxID=2302931 RepID=UPI0013D5859A|nr:substrate-binding domain-containing protein [Dysgonomonas sp. 520]NDW10968.1 response regulator [Dysgonomonas sp. 520]
MKIRIILCFIPLFIFLSCKQDKKARYIIGVSQCSDDLWRETMNNEMQREIGFHKDANIIIRSVKDDTPKQIKDIEWLIEQNVDLLIISPNESKALTPVIQKAYKSGIPVILVDRKIDTEDYTAYVGADNYQIGKEVGLYAVGILNGRGNIVEIRGWNGSTSDAERHAGFIDGLKNYPDVHIIAEARGNFLKEDAKNQMSNILSEYDHIDLVFAMNDPMAAGVYEASRKYTGKTPFIIGVDALPGEGGGIQNIQNDIQDASFIYPTGGDKVIDLAMKILKDKPFQRENTLYTTVIDKSNVRVLQLQTEQIAEQQSKVDSINSSLDDSLVRYTNQKTLFYISIIAIVLITFLLLVSFKAYRAKSKANLLLSHQNEEIKRQAEELREQKEQLLSISKQLEDATHAKLVFFTNISHEFKTPLSLILGPVESLLTDNHLTKEQHELLALIKKNSNRLLYLISEIIEFRSYENGKMKMNFSEGNLKEFIEDLNPLFSDWVKRKRVNFSFETDNASFDMIFDKEKVEKMYFNLISNALKFVNVSGEVKVGLKKKILEDGDYAQLSVFNSGSYIPPEILGNVFDRFYKVDQGGEGTGIGLSLTATLVEAHKGKIDVWSDEDAGTTFCVLFPLVLNNLMMSGSYASGYTESRLELETNEAEPELQLSTFENEDKPMVLIVEDNYDMRKFIQHILNREYNIITADNGADGLDKAKKFVPDIIISDVMMPEKDGFELCSLLKENVSTNHIPIILLTACSLDEQKSIGFESGADAYIPKPFNAHLLKIRVRKLIENRQKMIEAFGNSLINETKKESLGEMEQNFINDFQAYVEEYISNPELSVDELADHLKLSRSQLYRKIKSLTNYSPNELIRIVRLRYAKQLLNSKVKSISEVAYETGFSSPSYFAKCFKDIYGESPTEYIEQL